VLVGLGLGPGNPELLTLRAVRLLREADAVYVPGRLAAELVAPYCTPEVLPFPMTEDEGAIATAIAGNADRIAPVAERGLAVFGLIGDPNFFSTFSRLAEQMAKQHPSVAVRTEPGISAITACAAAAGLSLSDGFVVSDGFGEANARILLKVRRPREAADRLRTEGYTAFTLIERCYLSGERISTNDALPEESDYLSILVARR